MSSVSYETLQFLLQERKQREKILREEMLETASKNRHDLEELCKNRDTLRAVHDKPWLAALVQTAPVPVEKKSWDAYVKKHVLPWEKVTLPPDEEVDLDLLTHKILHPDPLLPAPRQKCSIGFYPSFAEVKAKGLRPRALVWGALIPNTVLIRLLWSTQTLTREISERWRRNRHLRLWEIMEKGLEGGSDATLEEDLDSGSQYSHRNKFRRGAFGDISEHHLVSVVQESEMAIRWDQVQPLNHRRRRRGKSHRGSRRKSHRSSRRHSSRETDLETQEEDSQRQRASSQPSITVTGDGAAQAASHASKRSSSAGSKGGKTGSRRRRRRGGSSGKSRSSGQSGTTGSGFSSRSSRPREDSEFDDRPVFQRVVGKMKEKMHVSMFMGENYQENARKQAQFMQRLRSKSWLMNMLPGVDISQIAPWELTDLMMNNIPQDNPVLVSKTVTELRALITQFPCQQSVVSMKEKTLALLDTNYLESGAFESILKLLQTLKASPDELIPLLLPLYPVCPEPTRRVIHTYLDKVGLRDPEKRLRHELLSWIVGSGTRARRNTTNTLALERKAAHFLKEWRENLETNTRLMEEDILRKKKEAQVTLNIVKALAKYESNVLKLDNEELYLELAKPPAVGFAESFTCVDVLNYFVEMCAPIPEEDTFSLGDKPLDTKEYRIWKRCNKQLVVASMANRSLRGDAPLSSGVQLPTSLVTHDQGGGLAPVPWPRLTVQVQLRLAGKYLFHQQDTERQDSATIGAVLYASSSPSPSPSPDLNSSHK